jgi:hypothetical protein
MSTDETQVLLRPKLRPAELVALKIQAVTEGITLAELVALILRAHIATITEV